MFHLRLALYTYDCLSTLPVEIERIWTQQWSVAAVTFYANRYGYLAYLVTEVAIDVGSGNWTSSLLRYRTDTSLFQRRVLINPLQLQHSDVLQLYVWCYRDVRESM